jgi:predicted acyl esterase
VWIEARDGVRLAAQLYLPDGDGPFAALLEALPYRMHDITSSYADSYVRFAGEGGFAVLRLDLRGTGSSGGILEDEYSDTERDDLRAVIEWLASQSWSTGRVGMFGTSYSGFNALHMAADDVPQLGAVVAMYATDDRYTDDVHWCGGVLRAVDLIDYPLYMVAMNALPPVPAVWGEGWDDEWRHRIDDTPPWMLDWIRTATDGPMWRRGSIRVGPDGAGYERIGCPTMIISGWADGYRNNTFRTISHLQQPWRLLAGPWVHKDPSVARPGPNVDSDREIIAFFNEHLRGGQPSSEHRGQVFVRRPTAPAPALAHHHGTWHDVDEWPPPGLRVMHREVSSSPDAVDELRVDGDVGMYAWNSCAGGLPWGQSLDQRADNARSITYDWTHASETMLMGNAVAALRVRSSAAVGHVSVKLCDVAPDGTSTLITRGMLDLAHVGCWPADGFGEVGRQPASITPDAWIDVRIELEATTWTLLTDHRLRLAIAGTDWPNCWPAPATWTLGVERGSVRLELPVVDTLPACTHPFVAGPGPRDDDGEGVVWQYEHDVLAGESRVRTRYGGRYEGADGVVIDDLYEGELGVSVADPSQAWALGRAQFDLNFNGVVCTSEATLNMHSDADEFHVTITLHARRNGEPVAARTWTEHLPR